MHTRLKAGVAIAVLLACAASTSPVRAEKAGTRRARAVWASPGRVITVEGFRIDGTRGPATIAAIGFDRCMGRSCTGALQVKRVADDHLTFDPSLEKARLFARLFDETFRVRWSSREPPEARSEGSTVIRRPATARGRVPSAAPRSDRGRLAFKTRGRRSDPFPLPLPLPGGDAPNVTRTVGSASCLEIRDSERALARLMNRARAARGLPRLKHDKHLVRVSRKHTSEMFALGHPYHTPPSVLIGRVTRWTLLGENVGRGRTPRSLHDTFMASRIHRENILKPGFRFVGVGAVQHGRLWVSVTFEKQRDPGTTLSMPSC